MRDVVLSKGAAKALERLTPKTQQHIVEALGNLKTNPFQGKRLRGELEGLFSLRIGEMRAVYEVDIKQQVVIIHVLGPRGSIYK